MKGTIEEEEVDFGISVVFGAVFRRERKDRRLGAVLSLLLLLKYRLRSGTE